MRSHINPLGIATATMLLCLTSPLLSPGVKNPGYPYSLLLSPAQAQTAQDRKAEARRLYEEGVKQFNRGQYQKALQIYQQVLAIESELNDQTSVGRTLNSIGGVYYERDQLRQALELYHGSLAIRRAVSDKAGEGRTLYNIGLAYQELQQNSQARKSFEKALKIFKEIGDRTGLEATSEALSPTSPELESGFSVGTILLDDYETQGTTPQVGSSSNGTQGAIPQVGASPGEGSTNSNPDDTGF
jgi:tetratricopeptide (TPR) repeat protein